MRFGWFASGRADVSDAKKISKVDKKHDYKLTYLFGSVWTRGRAEGQMVDLVVREQDQRRAHASNRACALQSNQWPCHLSEYSGE